MFLFILTAAVLFLLDLQVKHQILTWSQAGALPQTFCRGQIRIGFVKNAGLMLGLGKRHPRLVRLLPAAMLFLLAALLLPLLRNGSPWFAFGSGLVFGGGAGNLCDRLRRGFVVDWLNFPRIKKIRNLYFNLADFGIFLGILLVIFFL